jgi:ABC-type transporter Mla subunit MlaD
LLDRFRWDGDENSTTTDPLLAVIETAASTSNTTQSATGSAGATSGIVTNQSTQLVKNLLALFATGPNATDALSTLVEQLTGGSSQNGQIASQLLATLRNNSSGTLSLTDIFQQLFQRFPNGTGLDVKV